MAEGILHEKDGINVTGFSPGVYLLILKPAREKLSQKGFLFLNKISTIYI